MSRLALATSLALLALACQRREPVEVTRDRAAEKFLVAQIAELEKLVARAESGQLVTQDRIAIGLAESTANQLLNASLPREQTIGDRLVVRIEGATPIFRGNAAGLVFQASARGRRAGLTARLELAGRLINFRIEQGRLLANVGLEHFKVLETSLPDIAADVLDGLVRDNLPALGRLIPGIELPVHLEQSIQIAGLREGVVVAKPGTLPLQMTLAEVLPVNERLWILLDVKAGPWQRLPDAKEGT